jgi:4-hydroxy-tetrahydrodipicolinate synthase
VKESSGDLKQIGTILSRRPAHFKVWAGDDHLFLPCLAMGADGVVGVATHLCSREYRRMFDAYRAGRVDEAAEIHRAVLPLVDALFATTSPIPVKWAMNQRGFEAGECRLPLDGMPEALAATLRPLLAAY